SKLVGVLLNEVIAVGVNVPTVGLVKPKLAKLAKSKKALESGTVVPMGIRPKEPEHTAPTEKVWLALPGVNLVPVPRFPPAALLELTAALTVSEPVIGVAK